MSRTLHLYVWSHTHTKVCLLITPYVGSRLPFIGPKFVTQIGDVDLKVSEGDIKMVDI